MPVPTGTPAKLVRYGESVGLGELKLSSALNQPFDAEIELIADADYALTLKVALADDATFARFNLERPAYLSDFNCAVMLNSDGLPLIKITSSRPVTQPFITLLLEVVAGRGRLLREYTVLLDR